MTQDEKKPRPLRQSKTKWSPKRDDGVGFRWFPDNWNHDAGGGAAVWFVFLLYTLIILIVDQGSFFYGFLKSFGIVGEDSLTACIIVVLAFFMFGYLVVFSCTSSDDRPDFRNAPKMFDLSFLGLDKFHTDERSYPGMLIFVCLPALPFYWAWSLLRCVKLQLLVDIIFVAVPFLVHDKTVAVVSSVLYGLFVSLLCVDEDSSGFVCLLRFVVAGVLVYISSFVIF